MCRRITPQGEVVTDSSLPSCSSSPQGMGNSAFTNPVIDRQNHAKAQTVFNLGDVVRIIGPMSTRPESTTPTVRVPCPQCAHPTAVVVYRHFDNVSLICRQCEHTWATTVIAEPILKDLLPFIDS